MQNKKVGIYSLVSVLFIVGLSLRGMDESKEPGRKNPNAWKKGMAASFSAQFKAFGINKEKLKDLQKNEDSDEDCELQKWEKEDEALRKKLRAVENEDSDEDCELQKLEKEVQGWREEDEALGKKLGSDEYYLPQGWREDVEKMEEELQEWEKGNKARKKLEAIKDEDMK